MLKVFFSVTGFFQYPNSIFPLYNQFIEHNKKCVKNILIIQKSKSCKSLFADLTNGNSTITGHQETLEKA